ncbi:hypothetical protein ACFYPN_07080 [Streptomyces sp. NPDC005576]|uniref:hypothetical protein n=1 Tax=Streptomyces sp. NPDC005576 TaxID=3364726 RepID=UPI0036CC1337
MEIGTAVGVMGAIALPLLTQLKSLSSSLKTTCVAISIAAAVGEPLHSEAAIGPTVFAFFISSGIVLQSWRTDAVVDSLEREERGIPALLEGNAATRGLFDIVWLVRYTFRVKKHPLEERGRRPSES